MCRGVTGGVEFDARMAPVFSIACGAGAKAYQEKGSYKTMWNVDSALALCEYRMVKAKQVTMYPSP